MEIETQQDWRQIQAEFATDLIRSHRLLEKQIMDGLVSDAYGEIIKKINELTN